MIKGIIFDMDGTLADSIPLHFKVWQKIFSEFGVEVEFEEFKPFNGRLSSEFANHIKQTRNLEFDTEQIRQKKRGMIQDMYKEIQIFPGAKELIEELYNNGYKLAIASSEWHYHINEFLKHHGLEKYFSVILGVEDIVNHKPSPDVFLKAAQSLGFDTSECVVFEDTIIGVRAANNAGIKCIVTEASFSAKELSDADLIVKNFKEKEKIIEYITLL